jgi:hypothetical protein
MVRGDRSLLGDSGRRAGDQSAGSHRGSGNSDEETSVSNKHLHFLLKWMRSRSKPTAWP